ncbi:FG-GAP-like repeat-containing protein [Chelatococcus asaccharovorans]|uniref:FG-GAP-like repeat-containing protein n=1 Tax=Chelatococcus asaccharovorans TaxID=28210 RepID=UPI0014742138|nr:FG-GAP-like repeat-containing protein [Chelatococcus asaccharovorans]MBS7705574.1 VCBS repeat-containing protein [Chelatococcus asaccharovorans]
MTPDPVKSEPPAMATPKSGAKAEAKSEAKSEAKPDAAKAETDKANTDKADTDKKDAEKAETEKAGGPTVLAEQTPSAITIGDFDKKAPEDPEAPFNGSFTQRIPLEVPGFRGLEPKLSLVYDSSQGLRAGGMTAGLLGVGWDLGGLSDIVRVSRVNGAPRFNTDDTWLLDGAELVPCAQAPSSPSCSYGGNFTTRVESYKHILFNEGENSWTIKARDGTRYIYQSSLWFQGVPESPEAGHYRYMLQRIVDWRDNEVVFGYECPSFVVCYPIRTEYNGTLIKYFWQSQGDQQKTQLAAGTVIAVADRQLRSVFVTNDNVTIRAYGLDYEVSPATGLSRLIRVQQYGKDAVFDNGAVVGGTALPAIEISYTNTGVSFTLVPGIAGGKYIGDFNGDGLSDVFAAAPEGNTQVPPECIPYPAYTYLSTGSGYDAGQALNLSYPALNCYVDVGNDRWAVGDFDGDGRSDLVRSYQVVDYPTNPNDPNAPKITGFGLTFYRSTSSGWVASSLLDPLSSVPVYTGGEIAAADFDGDGRDELAAFGTTAGGGGLSGRFVWNGTTLVLDPNLALPPISIGGVPAQPPLSRISDFNGDGKADSIVFSQGPTVGDTSYEIWLSNGMGFISQGIQTFSGLPFFTLQQGIQSGDFNGDGKADVLLFAARGDGQWDVNVGLSTGRSLDRQIWAAPQWVAYTPGTEGGIAIGDLDGDGRSDVIIAAATEARLLLSRGTSFAISSAPIAGLVSTPGDVNGDGKADIASLLGLYLSQGGIPDLLSQYKNVFGGYTHVEGHELDAPPRHPLSLGQPALHGLSLDRQPDPGRPVAQHRQHARRHGDDL